MDRIKRNWKERRNEYHFNLGNQTCTQFETFSNIRNLVLIETNKVSWNSNHILSQFTENTLTIVKVSVNLLTSN